MPEITSLLQTLTTISNDVKAYSAIVVIVSGIFGYFFTYRRESPSSIFQGRARKRILNTVSQYSDLYINFRLLIRGENMKGKSSILPSAAFSLLPISILFLTFAFYGIAAPLPDFLIIYPFQVLIYLFFYRSMYIRLVRLIEPKLIENKLLRLRKTPSSIQIQESDRSKILKMFGIVGNTSLFPIYFAFTAGFESIFYIPVTYKSTTVLLILIIILIIAIIIGLLLYTIINRWVYSLEALIFSYIGLKEKIKVALFFKDRHQIKNSPIVCRILTIGNIARFSCKHNARHSETFYLSLKWGEISKVAVFRETVDVNDLPALSGVYEKLQHKLKERWSKKIILKFKALPKRTKNN